MKPRAPPLRNRWNGRSIPAGPSAGSAGARVPQPFGQAGEAPPPRRLATASASALVSPTSTTSCRARVIAV